MQLHRSLLAATSFIFIFSIISCTKPSASFSSSPGDNTYGMDGSRNWHGNYRSTTTEQVSPDSFVTSNVSSVLADKTFALQIIDANSIMIMGTAMSYKSKDTTLGIRYFGTANYGADGYVLEYYYNTNSMSYSYDYTSTSQRSSTTYQTY